MSGKRKTDTVAALFQSFVIDRQVYGITASTAKGYLASYRRLQTYDSRVDDRGIAEINKAYVSKYTEHLVDSGITSASVNHYLRSLRAFIYWCIDNDYLQRFQVKLVKQRACLKQPYTDEELRVMLRKPHQESPFIEWRSWIIVNWVLGVSSRASTMLYIKMEDVHLKEGYVITRHNKNGSVQSLPLVPSLQAALREYLKHRPPDSPYLFCSNDGKMLLRDSMSKSIAKYNRSRGVDKTSIHLLRHTFGKIWAENGGDVFGLRDMFGHSDIRMTQEYVNIYGSEHVGQRILAFSPLERIHKKYGRK